MREPRAYDTSNEQRGDGKTYGYDERGTGREYDVGNERDEGCEYAGYEHENCRYHRMAVIDARLVHILLGGFFREEVAHSHRERFNEGVDDTGKRDGRPRHSSDANTGEKADGRNEAVVNAEDDGAQIERGTFHYRNDSTRLVVKRTRPRGRGRKGSLLHYIAIC